MTGAVASFISYLWLLSLVITTNFMGDIWLRLFTATPPSLRTLPGKLLLGAITINALLIILFLIIPIPLYLSWILLAICIFLWWLFLNKGSIGIKFCWSDQNEVSADNLFIFCALIATTAWSLDVLGPIKYASGFYVIRAWQDIYIHLAQITTISISHGIGSLSDIQMGGGVAHPYHIASYFFPATLMSSAGISALEAYASLQTPLGLLLLAFGAYALGQSLFGRWPGFAGALGAILLPDAFQQGFQNLLFSYYWMLEISPAMAYGVASASLVFVFLLEFFRVQKFQFIAISYFFLLMTLIYKAQIFVGISYATLILPIFAYKNLSVIKKLITAAILTAIFFLVIHLTKNYPAIPTIAINGSGLDSYWNTLLGTQLDGWVRKTFKYFYLATQDNYVVRVFIFDIFLMALTFGFIPIFYILLFKHIKKNYSKIIWRFPIIVLTIYLVMSTTMAMDTRKIGSPEEFLHRPFVWAFFILCIWCTAGAYHYYFGSRTPYQIGLKSKFILAIGLLACLTNATYYGSRSQKIPEANIDHQIVPVCLVGVANFIKKHSPISDIAQASLNDPRFTLTALSERRPYGINGGGTRTPVGLDLRLQELTALKNFKSIDDVESFMSNQKISWYVVEPTEFIGWETDASRRLIFECGGYRVYHFL